ncbi:MAG: CHC2 zinc finger domain-containing protein [Pirellulaceae bacterium]|nr:toprim domain-containing protein [Planctomycetales bacterium]
MNIKTAKSIPLADALTRLGFSPVRRRGNDLWYASPFRSEKEASFKVSVTRNQWYDFGAGKGGDLIDLVKELYRLTTVSEALAQLDELEGIHFDKPPPRRQPDNDNRTEEDAPAFTIVENQSLISRSLIAYLQERGIDVELARKHLREVHYQRAEKVYFAIGLPNQSGGIEVRNRYFKGTIGRKDLSVIPGPHRRVFVFEGMFDYLTALTMLGGELDGTAIVLNSVATKEKAAQLIHELHPTVVELYRDNDTAGQELLNFMRHELPSITVVDWADLYAGHSDLNAWHVARSAPTPTKRALDIGR